MKQQWNIGEDAYYKDLAGQRKWAAIVGYTGYTADKFYEMDNGEIVQQGQIFTAINHATLEKRAALEKAFAAKSS